MKKVFVSCGHGGADPGAVGYIVEKEYTLKTGLALAEYLLEANVDVMMSRNSDIETDLNEKIRKCNEYDPDLVVDVHFNAGGGYGFEAYYSRVGGTGKVLAENVNSEISKIMHSRGIKTRLNSYGSDYFAIIRDTTAPAVLLEGGFVDSKSDADFIKDNYLSIARAYADGILKTLNIKVPEKNADSDKSEEDVWYKIQLKAFRNKEYAEKYLEELKAKGPEFSDAFITIEK